MSFNKPNFLHVSTMKFGKAVSKIFQKTHKNLALSILFDSNLYCNLPHIFNEEEFHFLLSSSWYHSYNSSSWLPKWI